METYVITREGLYAWLAALLERQPIMGPQERPDHPGFHYFDYLSRAGDFVTEYVTTTLPPKKAFFQPSETIFTFAHGDPPELNLISDITPFILAGVHPCDLSGLAALDKAYSHPPAEHRWAADRKLAVVIGMDCMPDAYCFCDSLGTIDCREGCDLFLTPIDEGFLIEVHTDAGAALLEDASATPAEEGRRAQAERQLEEKRAAMQASLNEPVDRVADALEAGGLSDVWDELAGRCYSCGTCNVTCPACFCFDMHDEFDLSLTSGLRRRTWDSCQLLEFALVAGRHNFRAERKERIRHRWERKFLYLPKRLGRPYCTGCGRCSRQCTVDINIVDVTNRILAYARKESSHD